MRATRAVELLCEGRCNPGFRKVVKAMAEELQRDGVVCAYTVTQFKGLVYTTHLHHPAAGRYDNYLCVACDTPRQWGLSQLDDALLSRPSSSMSVS